MRRLLATLVVIALGISVVVWWQQRVDDDPTAAVLSSARTAAATFFDLDHATIEEDLDAMAALSTGAFADDYAAERESLAQNVIAKSLTVSATIDDEGTALESLDGEQAQVLVAVDATTTAPHGGEETTQYRIRVALTHENDAWLVTSLAEVGQASATDATPRGTASDDAVRAALNALPITLSYDHSRLDENLTAAMATLTDSYAAEYAPTFEATARPLATSAKAIAEAHVQAAGLVNVEGDEALVLAFVDQVLLSSKGLKKNEPVKVTQTRVLVTLRAVDGAWRIDGIDPV